MIGSPAHGNSGQHFNYRFTAPFGGNKGGGGGKRNRKKERMKQRRDNPDNQHHFKPGCIGIDNIGDCEHKDSR